MYLNIDVAEDGNFRGAWGQYLCNAYPGAYGISIYSCSKFGGGSASGRFGPGREGTIDLEGLGQTAFTWETPSAVELAIDLPEHWQGEDAILYRARMTRDGIPAPTPVPTPEGPLLSSVVLSSEFKDDEAAALRRHGGKTLVLEGRRGTLIELSSGGAAIHIPDGFQPRALVLDFQDLNDVRDIGEGQQFRFRCTVSSFDYQYVHLDNCSVVR